MESPRASRESAELSAMIAGDSRSAGWTLDSTMSGHLHEAERLFTLAGEKKLAAASTQRKLTPLAGITLRPVVVRAASPGQKYLSRFLLLLDAINTRCPWCCARFSVNDLMLAKMTACLLPFIVESAEIARSHGDRLRNLIRSDLRGSNMLWITNRQQGKTTSLSKMIAALMLGSPAGGNLVFVYSTSLDRAAEVMRAAKQIVDWVRSTTIMEDLGFPSKVSVELDNSREFTLISGYGAKNKCRARPKGADQCRGDAPKFACVDEIAFTEQQWYLRFLMPLQAVDTRRFIYATTPPLAGSWFSDTVELIKKQNADNDYHFEYTQHTLACDACNAAGVGAECIHRLHFVPAWKSLSKMTALQKLVPASERTAFNTEVLGMEEVHAAGYVPEELLTKVRADERRVVANVERVYVAIDPASHRRSSMGLAAVCFGESGEYVVLGVASIACTRPQLVQVQLLIKKFLKKLRAVPELATALLTPIVECNGSEIYSSSLVEIFQGFPPVHNAFTKKETGVAQNVGVFTTHGTKIWSLTNLCASLLKGAVRVSPSLFTVCESIYNPRTLPVTPDEALEICFRQISRFRDHDDGSVSGKGSGEEDDAGMAFLLATQWAMYILADERRQKERARGPR